MSTELLCKRTAMRSSLFLMATIASETLSGPVRVRNLSNDGAMIEGAELPPVGKECRLRRADLSASGSIVWNSGRSAGIRFDRPINVMQWMPAKSGGQQQVDAVVHQQRTSPAGSAAADASSGFLKKSEELSGLADMIDALADALSKDEAIVARHLERLQVLDIAAQKLRKLAAE
ncbi:hypothetical protein GRI38_10710 [Altererythrobacter aurantiacus]|uniref:PilZ domain-containing protein n=1 Tax=Parapontixanthobacter aurantiacus TaxID=1463599 RepID=A0A844ZF43_9SPHN|nr:hypothetical protein [Parapontixanthobacter aurantiacus]MXO86495.1 hypothetical protein [Parapontixanthobacter aurantiacus]